MGRTMGHHRKGEDRGSVDRPGPRNARIRRGKKTPPHTRNKGRKSSGGKVIPLRAAKRYDFAARGLAPFVSGVWRGLLATANPRVARPWTVNAAAVFPLPVVPH